MLSWPRRLRGKRELVRVESEGEMTWWWGSGREAACPTIVATHRQAWAAVPLCLCSSMRPSFVTIISMQPRTGPWAMHRIDCAQK